MRKLIIGLTEKTGLNISVSPGQIIAAVLVVVLVGVAGGAYWFGGKNDHEPALVLNTMPATSDGIQVRGDWTVTVTNPDGTVNSALEFNNDLNRFAGSALTAILAGSDAIKFPPYVSLGLSSDGAESWHTNCQESISRRPPTVVTRDVEVVGNPLRITTTCTVAGEPGTLMAVSTGYKVHPGKSFTSWNDANSTTVTLVDNTFTNSGEEVGGYELTAHTLDTPVPVVENQVISVNVVISFN